VAPGGRAQFPQQLQGRNLLVPRILNRGHFERSEKSPGRRGRPLSRARPDPRRNPAVPGGSLPCGRDDTHGGPGFLLPGCSRSGLPAGYPGLDNGACASRFLRPCGACSRPVATLLGSEGTAHPSAPWRTEEVRFIPPDSTRLASGPFRTGSASWALGTDAPRRHPEPGQRPPGLVRRFRVEPRPAWARFLGCCRRFQGFRGSREEPWEGLWAWKVAKGV